MWTPSRSSLSYTRVLSDGDLMRVAPSIFASRPYAGMSDRYTFIPTIDVVNKLRAEGFQPVMAAESRATKLEKVGFSKHMIRFRDQRNAGPVKPALGNLYPEVVLTNGHDGSSAYRIDAGIFRLACLNGLMVQDSEIGSVRTRHTGRIDDIIEATYEVVEDFPRLLDRVEEFGAVQLAAPHQRALAEAAIALRWDEGHAPVTPAELVRPLRSEDSAPTLWNTLNTAQERIVRGGQRSLNPQTRKREKVRAISSVSENARLNKALWTLAERMKELIHA